jgi:cell fate regulator YaaT (PSP1 superfamily)
MQTIVGVRFKKAGKIYYFDPGELGLAKDDPVIVETARGIEFGHVVIPERQVDDAGVVTPLKPVLRKATEKDVVKVAENEAREAEALRVCTQKIEAHKLDMNLVSVEYTFDVSKIIFYFTAEGRVDFRELVKDLASIFRTRIELRQIGVRDEAKMLGGIGCCGRSLCCSTFLGDFEPVSIRMAKEQNLSLNPAKISGICGRLMCCLKYESNLYAGQPCRRQSVPKPGARVIAPTGEGSVVAVDPAKKTVSVKRNDGVIDQLPLDEVAEVSEKDDVGKD